MLVLYTDGLTEAGRDTAAGEANLLSAVSAFDPSRYSEPQAATQIWNAMRNSTGVAHDDVALLTVHFEHTILDFADRTERWCFDARDANAAYAVREDISAHLSARGVDRDQMSNAETIYCELIANAAQHAPGKIEVVLDMTQKYAVLHAIDEGSGFFGAPKLPDAYADHGRGLFLVAALARNFSVRPRAQRPGSHVRAVLQGRLNQVLTASERKSTS